VKWSPNTPIYEMNGFHRLQTAVLGVSPLRQFGGLWRPAASCSHWTDRGEPGRFQR